MTEPDDSHDRIAWDSSNLGDIPYQRPCVIRRFWRWLTREDEKLPVADDDERTW